MTVLGITLIVAGSCVAVLNWLTLIATSRRGRFVSAVPIVGAALLGAGLTVIPQTRPWAWAALIADYGTLALILVLPRLARECWSVSRFNLLHAFDAEESGRHIRIRLFRRGIAVIRADFSPPVRCDDSGSFDVSFSWVAKWKVAGEGYSITDSVSGRELVISAENGKFTTRELNYPSDSRYKHHCLDALELQPLRKA